MRKIILFSLFILSLVGTYGQTKVFKTEIHTDKNGYKYETVTNDDTKTRVYTLKNGLKIYLSVCKDEPVIQTYIAVRAGSTFDPADNTGLAHYLEHMMFKGTSKFGTVNWKSEKPLLDKISELYEQHKKEANETKKKQIYRQIDSVSQLAAQFAVPNEYDKMLSSIGATGTNAWTSNEQTVYVNNIPANELEKWLSIESERFSELVLRLFHTELETVYEEFNMGQDNDSRKMYYNFFSLLFPDHPYGTQTTIGKGEHLKNPSMVAIHNYWNTYYRPNNMAVCLAGDLDMENTVKLIDQYFGKLKSGEIPKKNNSKTVMQDFPKENSVLGPETERMMLGYRLNGIKSEDRALTDLTSTILTNGTAGLVDINLNQKQLVQSAGSYPYFLKEHGMFVFYGVPKTGQKLEEVKDLLINELNKIKKGEFDDWLLEAAVNDFKMERIKALEGNARASEYIYAFTNELTWEEHVSYLSKIEKITKKDIINFANKNFNNNYAVVYKRKGIDSTTMKVDKPTITPIPTNRELQSEFVKNIDSKMSPDLSPVFVDFDKEIQSKKIKSDIQLNYIKNPDNELFQLLYVFDIGKFHDKELALAVSYLQYLGTNKYSPAELKKEMYKSGLSFGVSASERNCYVYITGLQKYTSQGIDLLEHIIENAKADSLAYKNYVQKILKERNDAKMNKSSILWAGLMSQAKYGDASPQKYFLSETDLKNINPENLTKKIKELRNYKHEILYYGQLSHDSIAKLLNQKHFVPTQWLPSPTPKEFVQKETTENKVLFAHYDMVQNILVFVSKDKPFDISILSQANVFGEYFGDNMSSIVFQEIRESKALAYSAFAQYSTPSHKEESFFVVGYVATQTDKLGQAADAMLGLLNQLPKADNLFELSKKSVLKRIDAERIIKTDLYWTRKQNDKLGIYNDYRKDTYTKIQTLKFEDIQKFYDERVKGKKYTILVIGNKEKTDFEALNKYGVVKEFTMEELFGY